LTFESQHQLVVIPDDKLESVIKIALLSIMTRPQGAKKAGLQLYGFNNRTWATFCKAIISTGVLDKMKDDSPLYCQYRKFWPDCSDEIEKSILGLEDKIKNQEKIRKILGN
jgi:hypothetical protein